MPPTLPTPLGRLIPRGFEIPAPAGVDAEFLVGAAHAGLSVERVVTDTPTIEWDLATAAQAKAKLTAAARTFAIAFIIDGGGAVISTGIKGDLEIPIAGTITGWTLLADVSGSIAIDTWKDTYANYPPTVADTMWGTKPALSSQTKNQATGLSIAVAAGDIIRYNVDSATTLTRALLSFQFQRT